MLINESTNIKLSMTKVLTMQQLCFSEGHDELASIRSLIYDLCGRKLLKYTLPFSKCWMIGVLPELQHICSLCAPCVLPMKVLPKQCKKK
jgi:hypothetical protein